MKLETNIDGEQNADTETVEERRYLEGLEQLHAISSKVRRRILQQLVEEPLTVTQLGRALDMPPPTVHYHVRELVRVGLVRPAGTRERRGILEKYYRAVARTFLVPPYPLQGRSPTEQIATVDELLTDISHHIKAVLSDRRGRDDESDPVQLGVRVLFLRPEDLPAIAQQIEAILAPYATPRDGSLDREHIVVHLAVPTHPRHAGQPE